MSHSAVYYIAAESYNDLKAIRSGGIIDTHLVVHGGGVTPSAQFFTDCKNAGTSPIVNNGNDGVAGWNGQDSYNANLAAMGAHAIGGESEQAPEIDSIMRHTRFLDYGGQGTGGGTNNDVWNVTHPGNVSGYGAAGYYETYDASTNLWRWPTLGPGMLHAKSHGVKEIGLMVGNWMMAAKCTRSNGTFDHAAYAKAIKARSTAQDYVDIANSMEANGVQFAGIGIWAGYGSNMNSLYNQFASWYKEWQAIWPANMKTMKERYEGTGPTPPTPTAQGTGPATCTTGDKIYVFVQGIDNALWSRCSTAGVWSAWESLSGKITSSPAATVTSDGTVHVFARGTDKALWHRAFTTKWSAWESLGGQIE